MLPTLKIGQHVTVDVGSRKPKIGDIIVFHPPAGADSPSAVCGRSGRGANGSQACDQPTAAESSATFIKRVVGAPGDRISLVNGHVIRNGVQEKEPFITPCSGAFGCTFPTPIVIPPGDYFTLGDNRGESNDSRFWGPVPGAWIIGIVAR
jgi:signal peptidase I